MLWKPSGDLPRNIMHFAMASLPGNSLERFFRFSELLLSRGNAGEGWFGWGSPAILKPLRHKNRALQRKCSRRFSGRRCGEGCGCRNLHELKFQPFRKALVEEILPSKVSRDCFCSINIEDAWYIKFLFDYCLKRFEKTNDFWRMFEKESFCPTIAWKAWNKKPPDYWLKKLEKESLCPTIGWKSLK